MLVISQPDLLADVLVLVETLLGQVALAQVHTQLQVFEHDGLVDLLPCSMFLALDDIIQNIQGWLLLANLQKLYITQTEIEEHMYYTHINYSHLVGHPRYLILHMVTPRHGTIYCTTLNQL